MSNNQEPIEPEIVDEIPKQDNKNINVGKNKKGLSKIFLILAVIYIISPLDIVPEVLIPVLGWVDDFAVGALAIINYLNQQKK
jgi:uncharacterized membrane protein YkvA (DUF1232 family)